MFNNSYFIVFDYNILHICLNHRSFNLISHFILSYILYLRVLPCKCEFTVLHPICFYNRATRRVHKMQARFSTREKETKEKTAVQKAMRDDACKGSLMTTKRLLVCHKLKSPVRAESWELSVMRSEVQWERGSYRTHVVSANRACVTARTGSPGCKNGDAFWSGASL